MKLIKGDYIESLSNIESYAKKTESNIDEELSFLDWNNKKKKI